MCRYVDERCVFRNCERCPRHQQQTRRSYVCALALVRHQMCSGMRPFQSAVEKGGACAMCPGGPESAL